MDEELFDRLAEMFMDDQMPAYWTWATELATEGAEREVGFLANLRERWGEVNHTVGVFIDACDQIARNYEAEHFPGAAQKTEALALLHARATTVAREINLLVMGGFADGSRARARTLHEIAVITVFLSQSDESLAARFLASDTSEQVQSLLRRKDLDHETRQQGLEAKESLEGRFPGITNGSYGWAQSAFPDLGGKRVGVAHLAERVGASPGRFHAFSAAVHGNAEPLHDGWAAKRVQNFHMAVRTMSNLSEPLIAVADDLGAATTSFLAHVEDIGEDAGVGRGVFRHFVDYVRGRILTECREVEGRIRRERADGTLKSVADE